MKNICENVLESTENANYSNLITPLPLLLRKIGRNVSVT